MITTLFEGKLDIFFGGGGGEGGSLLPSNILGRSLTLDNILFGVLYQLLHQPFSKKFKITLYASYLLHYE